MKNHWFVVTVLALFAISQVAVFTGRNEVFLAVLVILMVVGYLVLRRR